MLHLKLLTEKSQGPSGSYQTTSIVLCLLHHKSIKLWLPKWKLVPLLSLVGAGAENHNYLQGYNEFISHSGVQFSGSESYSALPTWISNVETTFPFLPIELFGYAFKVQGRKQSIWKPPLSPENSASSSISARCYIGQSYATLWKLDKHLTSQGGKCNKEKKGDGSNESHMESGIFMNFCLKKCASAKRLPPNGALHHYSFWHVYPACLSGMADLDKLLDMLLIQAPTKLKFTLP